MKSRPPDFRSKSPFVEGKDDGAALARDEIGDGEVLFLERLGRIHHHDHAIGEADRGERALHRHFLQRLARAARLFAQARRIVQQNRAPARFPRHRDGVTREARLRAGERTFLPEQKIEQDRLADIRAADQRQPQRLGGVDFSSSASSGLPVSSPGRGWFDGGANASSVSAISSIPNACSADTFSGSPKPRP